ncbi:MAG: hypothetical protein GXP54_08340 [Deltaproteobacteria bacterium]|nr:hypothetical protein [Deltaproteobacteria bacterium]
MSDTGNPPFFDAADAVDSTPADVYVQSDTQGNPDASTTDETGDAALETEDAEPALAALVLVGVIPGKGIASGNETVVLTGDGFVDGMVVVFDQTPSHTVIVSSPQNATVITPPHPPGTVRVVVNRPGAKSVLEDAFTYSNLTVLTSVDPIQVPSSGGAPITLSGAGFNGGMDVVIGGRPSPQVQVVDDSMAVAVAPQGGPGPADVLVASASGQAVLHHGVFYFEKPSLELVAPAAGTFAGGTLVSITGTGFHPGTEVSFGILPGGDTQIIDLHHLTVKSPAYGATGPVDIVLDTPYGSAVLDDAFYYFDPTNQPQGVQVLSVSPDQGPLSGGNLVAVVATGLDADQNVVYFGAKAAKVVDTYPESNTVVVEAPPGVPGPVPVGVTTSAGQGNLPNGYTYWKDFQLTEVAPGSGPAAGGTQITIWGSSLEQGATVLIGGLPATAVKYLSSSAVSAVTPPGSPGPADVTVLQGSAKAVLAGGFTYESETRLMAIDPDQGSIAGGTLVHLFGSNLTGDERVFFGEAEASHVVAESSNELTCRTPAGAIGPVDVILQADGVNHVLPQAYTYFDPTALYGGTWGGPTAGTLNVTILDATQGGPIMDAFVIVSSDPTTPYQGYTGPDGVVSFSGPDLEGPLTISASKDCYNNSSVVSFDAANVTVYLQYVCPSQGGGMPPGVAPGQISGKVLGLGKYILAPPGNCWIKGTGEDGVSCKYCNTDLDCGPAEDGNRCLQIGDVGKFCTTPCLVPEDCLEGYVCLGTAVGTTQCIPSPGEKTAICVTTQPDIFTKNPIEPGSGSEINADKEYSIVTRLGDLAVVCLGGIRDPDTDTFTPYAMGVKRHLFVGPGEKLTDVNVLLDIPMDRSFRVYLDDPPSGNPDPSFNYLFTFYDFGSDGVFQEYWASPFAFGDPAIVVENQPRAFKGDLYDVTYTFMGGAFSSTADNTPFSIALAQQVEDLDDDIMFRLDGSTWSVVKTGVKLDVFGMWGTSGSDLFAVGQDGAVLYFDGFGFTQQPVSGVTETLRAVGGSGPTDAWAVGDKGTVLHFSQTGWERVDVAVAANKALKGVACNAADDCFAVAWGFAMHWDGIEWSAVPGVPGKELDAVVGTGPGTAIAVGYFGTAINLTPALAVEESTGFGQTLRAVTVAPDGSIWAVGDSGVMARKTAGAWTLVPTGTTRPLWAVAAQGDRVLAFGDAGTIVTFADGGATSTRLEGYGPHLRAAYADQSEGGPVMSMGISQLLLGPFLQVPRITYPKDNGELKDLYLEFKAAPGLPASFHYVMIAIPSLFGDIPVWEFMASGDTWKIKLPDFENIEGTPGIPKGTMLKLTLLRAMVDGFSMDNFDYTDLSPFAQKAWSVDIIMFSRP